MVEGIERSRLNWEIWHLLIEIQILACICMDKSNVDNGFTNCSESSLKSESKMSAQCVFRLADSTPNWVLEDLSQLLHVLAGAK